MNAENQPFSSAPLSSQAAADIRATAAGWAARRDQGMAPAEKNEFLRWLAADPRHEVAFRQADVRRDELDWPWHTGTVDQVMVGLNQRSRRRRLRRTIGAAVALVALTAGAALWQMQRSAVAPASMTPVTKLVVLQPERQVLPDGTVMELKADAQASTDYSDDRFRVVTLTRGTAHFQVAHDPQRPFIVHAGGVAVRAVGTAFAVELEPHAVTVMVTDGRIAVNQKTAAVDTPTSSIQPPPAAPPVLVDAGNSVVVNVREMIASPVVRPIPQLELSERLAWRIPRLEFSGTPLAEVVTMINRHNRVQFVIADASLSELRLSGNLRADKMDALVQLLESDFSVKADYRGSTEIVLHKRP